jgi:hypothetical protein
MARVKSESGDSAGAAEHSARALELVNSIAANVADEKLRENFVTAARASIAI